MDADAMIFLVACVVVAVSPGPAVLYIVARTLDQGLAAGLVSMLGITTGGVVNVVLAAAGVAAVASTWPVSLFVLQVVGALYLIWLGVQRVLHFRASTGDIEVQHQSLGVIYRQAVIVNLTNPKTILFLLAFLPQFVTVDETPVWMQMLALGLAFTLIATITDGMYAVAAGRIRSWLKRDGAPKWPGLISAGVYAGLGALTLWDAFANRL
jgi:threonine/homoserine/homoserine lactone efflux protein